MKIVDGQVHIWANAKPTNPNHRQVATSPTTSSSRKWTRAAVRDDVLRELPWRSGRDRELVMGGALCRWLDWTLP